MNFIFNAFKIATLVTVGFLFVFNIPNIIRFVKEHKNMNKNEVFGKITKWVGVFVSVLGLAFFGGSFLAYVQGVLTQIGILAVFGTLCIILGIVLFVVGYKKTKKA